MSEQRSLIKNMKDEWEEVRDRAGEMLHQIWPFRAKKEGQQSELEARRTYVSFPLDICENDSHFVLVGDLPGVHKSDVNIQLCDNELTISGRFQVALDNDERIIHREIPGADFRRTLTLSNAVDRDQVEAELKNGLLTVKLAKSQQVKPREIPISS